MDKLRVQDMLTLHGFSHAPLDGGVRVSALVTGRPDGESEAGPEILVRPPRQDTCLTSERHTSYEDAAARYVELLAAYREGAASSGPGAP
jgi:hypothetical protein